MKIQCDVCNKDEASVFCSADEAALCAACDHRVHHANKLAGKHQRFSLLQPPPKQFPLCDICREKRAFLFCQQDRAILCRDCDIPIHKANEHTQKHNRFLLTGVKFSATSAVYSSPSTSSSSAGFDVVPNLKPEKPTNKSISAKISNPNPPTMVKNTSIGTVGTNYEKSLVNNAQLTSVSEYLMETLPGWHVEDFLDSSSPSQFGLCKNGEDEDVLPIWDGDLDSNLSSLSSSENIGIWVPQTPTPLYPTQCSSSNLSFGGQIGLKEMEINGNKSSKKWRDDSCFTVPQINPPSSASKRFRTYW